MLTSGSFSTPGKVAAAARRTMTVLSMTWSSLVACRKLRRGEPLALLPFLPHADLIPLPTSKGVSETRFSQEPNWCLIVAVLRFY